MNKKKEIKSPFEKGKYRYNPNSTPIIYEGLLRRGLDNNQVREYFNISKITFNNWLANHPEFREIKDKVSRHVNFEVEGALLKRALGYEYKEVRKEFIFDTDQNGNAKKTPKAVKVIETTKHIPPDLTAIKMWLLSKEPEEWQNVLENASITQVAINNEMPSISLEAPKETPKKKTIDSLNRTRITKDSIKKLSDLDKNMENFTG